jgi:JmjC domain, hydroxylase
LPFLYTLPNFLPYDLLNEFLLRFGNPDESSDYRFVYWGPKGSTTALHIDVLQSLSWSYNVHGSKEWTFYVPTTARKNNDGHIHETAITVQQNTGELVLVPSGWKHSVINQQETLSINHNWITTDILLSVWNCILTELYAVDTELASWSIDCNEARESMLRGCVGLNVSLYFFMTLRRGLDLILELVQESADMSLTTYRDRAIHDLVCISNAMQLLCNDNSSIHLTQRLTGTLNNVRSADEAVLIATELVTFVESHYI